MRIRGCLARTATPSNPARPGALATIIFDAHGVRAAVRAVLFVVLLAVAVTVLSFVLRVGIAAVPAWHHRVHAAIARMHAGVGMPAWLTAMNEAMLLACALFATWGMTVLEGRTLREAGLAARRVWGDLAGGFAVGFVMLSVLVAALLAFGGARLAAPSLAPGAAFSAALAWFGACLLIGCAEEIAFRGYVFAVLREAHGFWPAAIVVMLLFGAAHGFNIGENPTGLATAAAVSVLFCLAIRRTGTLWWVIGCHGAWDWAENYFYGSADSGMHSLGRLFTLYPQGNLYLSGGRDGPEGSFLCLVVIVATIAVLPLLLRPRVAQG